MNIDMHVHTSYGSSDSNLSLDELHNKSKILNIDAVCLTEHGGPWSLQSITQAQQKMDNLKLLNAMEIETEVGHITAFGFTQYISGMRNPESLRQIADKEGAFIAELLPTTTEDVEDESSHLDALGRVEAIDFDQDENEVDMTALSPEMRALFN